MDINKNTISYNDYIKGITSLSIDEQLKLIKALSSAIQTSSRKKETKKNIMELEGLGAQIWQGIDAQEYVRRERESWD
ncbi:MAG: hypothetical protein PVG39_15170 [Desulfobacteraceae bacterium]|jgi:hypothetical protein